MLVAKLKKPILLGTLLIIVVFLSRLWLINQLPPAITHDEIHYVVDTYSLVLTGKGFDGDWQPTMLSSSHPLFAELPAVVMAPIGSIVRSRPFLVARLTQAILGTAIIPLLALLAYQLTHKKQIAVWVFILAIFNPWLFQVSKTSFDSILSIFFYILGLTLLFQKKPVLTLGAIVSFMLGFFQYQGHKLLLLPIIFSSLLYLHTVVKNKSTKKQLRLTWLIAAIFTMSLVVFFWIHLQTQTAQSRNTDLLFNDQSYLATQADAERANVLLNPYTKFFSNKATVLFKTAFKNTAESLNPTTWFVFGDSSRNPTSVWTWGMFYLVDGLLILIGMYWLFAHKKSLEASLLLFWLMTAFLPSILNTHQTWIFLRASFAVPVFLIFDGIGAYALWQFASKKPFQTIIKIGLIGIYGIFIVFFLYDYRFRFPVYATGSKSFGERVMASYVARLEAKTQRPIFVLGDEAFFIFEEYLVLANKLNPITIEHVQNAFKNNVFTLDTVHIDTACIKSEYINAQVTVLADQSTAHCQETTQNIPDSFAISEIRSPYSGDVFFSIYNDLLCANQQAGTQPKYTFKNLEVETLSDEAFCQNFIFKKNLN